MCFWSKPSAPAMPAPVIIQSAPTPAPVSANIREPIPSPTPEAPKPTTVEPSETAPLTAEARRKRISSVRKGLLSTIKTSGQGVVGTGANLYGREYTTGKQTLGS